MLQKLLRNFSFCKSYAFCYIKLWIQFNMHSLYLPSISVGILYLENLFEVCCVLDLVAFAYIKCIHFFMFTFNWKVDSIKTLSLQRAQNVQGMLLLQVAVHQHIQLVLLGIFYTSCFGGCSLVQLNHPCNQPNIIYIIRNIF